MTAGGQAYSTMSEELQKQAQPTMHMDINLKKKPSQPRAVSYCTVGDPGISAMGNTDLDDMPNAGLSDVGTSSWAESPEQS